jgi:hypothetical protein
LLCTECLPILHLGVFVKGLSFAVKHQIQRKQEKEPGGGEGAKVRKALCLQCLPLGRKREIQALSPEKGLLPGCSQLSLSGLRENIYFPRIASVLTHKTR